MRRACRVHRAERHELVAGGQAEGDAGRVGCGGQAGRRGVLDHAVDERHLGEHLARELRGERPHGHHDPDLALERGEDDLALRPVARQVVFGHLVRGGGGADRFHAPGARPARRCS